MERMVYPTTFRYRRGLFGCLILQIQWETKEYREGSSVADTILFWRDAKVHDVSALNPPIFPVPQ